MCVCVCVCVYNKEWMKCRLPKKNLNYKPEGRRNIGRPQTRWEVISGRKEGTANWPKSYN